MAPKTMDSDALIMSLAASTPAVPRFAVLQRLVLGLVGGGLVCLALVLGLLGPRANLDAAMLTGPFWMKAGYTIALALIATGMVARLARPDRAPGWSAWLIAVPVAVLAGMALRELIIMPPVDWEPMVMGQSASVCSVLVVASALPVFAGLMWAFRALAPTRLRLAGAAAGLAAGSVGATVYGLHCAEATALFVISWYTLGIAASAALGALAGPRLLRW
ncbi:MAG: DUF1109 domain-containing protein [Sphingomonas sp.]